MLFSGTGGKAYFFSNQINLILGFEPDFMGGMGGKINWETGLYNSEKPKKYHL